MFLRNVVNYFQVLSLNPENSLKTDIIRFSETLVFTQKCTYRQIQKDNIYITGSVVLTVAEKFVENCYFPIGMLQYNLFCYRL